MSTQIMSDGVVMRFGDVFVFVLMFSIAAIHGCSAALQLTTPADVTARSHNEQGMSLASKGLHDRAIAEFNKALALSPDFVPAFANRGLVYLRTGLYDEAIADFDRVIEIVNKNAGAGIIPASSYVPKEQFAQLYFDRGTARLNKAEYDLAIADFTKALEIDQKFAKAFNNRGATYLENLQFDLAMSDLERALQLDPKYALAYMNRGLLYYRKGDNDLANGDYNEAIRADPKLALVYANRGRAYAKNNRFDLAFADFTKAQEINPNLATAYEGLATLYVLQAKYSEAEPLFKRALMIFEKTLGPTHPFLAEVLEHYAVMLRKTGRDFEAAAMDARSKAIRDIYKHN